MNVGVDRLVFVLGSKITNNIVGGVVVDLLRQASVIEVFVIEQRLHRVGGHLGYCPARVGDNKLDVAANIQRVFYLGLALLHVRGERRELLLQQQANARAEGLCLFLLKVLGCLELGLYQIQRFCLRDVVDGVDPVVVEVIDHGGSSGQRREVEALVESEPAERTVDVFGSRYRRVGWPKERRQVRYEARVQYLLQNGHGLRVERRHQASSHSIVNKVVSSTSCWS